MFSIVLCLSKIVPFLKKVLSRISQSFGYYNYSYYNNNLLALLVQVRSGNLNEAYYYFLLDSKKKSNYTGITIGNH